jgi:MFS family permease
MDIGKSITFVAEDEKWLEKLGIGALITAVPILNFAWSGFMVDIMRNVGAGEAKPLPDWSDLGDKFVRGLIITLAGLIYALPAILVGCLLFGLSFVPLFAVSGQGDQGMNQGLALGSTGLLIAAGCCIGLYGLVISFVFPAVFINYSRQGSFGSCFQFGEVMRLITTNLSEYATAWVIIIVAGLLVGLVIGAVGGLLSFIPCIGWIIAWAISAIAGAYLGAVYAHLFGQVGANPVNLYTSQA